MPYKMPQSPSKLTGKTRARVIGWKETVSKLDNSPQIEFEFETERNNHFVLWLTISSIKAVTRFLEAGILTELDTEEFDIVPVHKQPFLWVTLDQGKLIAFNKIG